MPRYDIFRHMPSALVAALLLAGCSQGRLTTAERPAAQRTINAVTDTIELQTLPPVPTRGAVTEPQEVRVYLDTLPAPEVQVQRVSVDREEETIELQYAVGDSTILERFQLPAYGETLDVEAETDTSLAAQIRGVPQPEEVDVIRPEREPSWWERLGRKIRLVFAFLIGLVGGLLAGRLIP